MPGCYSFFLKNDEALASEACDSVDCLDAWLKLETPLAAGFFAVAGCPGASACRLRFWRLRAGGFPSLSTMLQLSPVAAELELTAEDRLPRRDVFTLTITSPKASASSRGPRDEAAMSPQAGLLLLRDFSAPGPAGLTNCVPAPLSVLERPEHEGGLDLGALGSWAVEGPEGLTDCVFFPPAEAEADLDGEGLV